MHTLMEFILPVLSASGEAVIMVLIVVVLFLIGRGRLQPSEKTLVIERPGQYRMILAPGLNLAQPFIEAVAKRISLRDDTPPEGLPLHFEVRDKEVATPKQPVYLLAIYRDNGILRFEARSAPHDSPLAAPAISNAQEHDIEEAVRVVSESWGIGVARVDNVRPAISNAVLLGHE